MSELQDALDRYDDPNPRVMEWEDVMVLAETARRVANPDIEAAAIERHRNGRPKCYEGPHDIGCYCWDTTKTAVNKALGITEDE